jgi:tetratricopeptide (TPR) repeat protein
MAQPRVIARRIEALIAKERWQEARRLIQGFLRERPDDHFMISRLALTHYEQRNYRKAMSLERRALVLAPHCPMALWGLAGANHMLGHLDEATRIYRRLIRRGAPRLARGRCGEGIRDARRLVADCWFRLGVVRELEGRVAGAMAAYRKHLRVRTPCGSIYSATDVRRRLKALAG